jgi:hypothetical protein
VSLPANVADLQQILETDGSVWTVNGAGKGLERRVDQTAYASAGTARTE